MKKLLLITAFSLIGGLGLGMNSAEAKGCHHGEHYHRKHDCGRNYCHFHKKHHKHKHKHGHPAPVTYYYPASRPGIVLAGYRPVKQCYWSFGQQYCHWR